MAAVGSNVSPTSTQPCPACKGTGSLETSNLEALHALAGLVGFTVAMPVLSLAGAGLLIRIGCNGYEAAGGGCILAYGVHRLTGALKRARSSPVEPS